MTKELDELRRNLAALPDTNLLRIATVDASEYRPEALQIARDELLRRGVVDITPEAYEARRAATGPNILPVAEPLIEPPAGYAGFWKRLGAFVIDFLIVYASFLVVGFACAGILVPAGMAQKELNGILFVLWVAANFLYWVGLESSLRQATYGKVLLGVKVTNLRGDGLTFGQASRRWAGKLASFLTFGIGFLMAGFTRRKQALHDLLTDCLVVNR
jgi:uncharacterized RDD family membrane protein YckC